MPLIPLLFFMGCAGMYFRDVGKPPMPPPRFDLVDWPYNEYWTGIVFNGKKIGFSHFTLSSSGDAENRFEIRSEVALCIRFLTVDKTINLQSFDRVAEDLSLDLFEYDYDMDGNRLKLSGRVTDSRLEVEIETAEQTSRKTIPVNTKLYPTSIIGLYPVLHGLEVGRTYSYKVYDGETQTIDSVRQEILAYEESDLFPGQAYKIKTHLHGQNVTTWIGPKGRPLLEMSLGGVFISELESKSAAERYLAQAALNKEETLLDFSLIKSNVSILDPSRVNFMEITLFGIDKSLCIPNDERQRCQRRGQEVFCRINALLPDDNGRTQPEATELAEQYLQPSYIIPCNIPQIRNKAAEIVANEKKTQKQIRSLVHWLQENIKQAPVDVFTALEVLETGKAECQGIALLYSAFARALGIPTRVVNGIVYSHEFKGFLYHTWVESFVDGHWISVDPTFQQIPADATHIKLIEGEKVSDLLPLVNLIGHLRVKIISVEKP